MKDLIKNYHKLSAEKQKLVKLLLKEQGIDINAKVILPQKRDEKLYPLSFAQQRLWFLEQLEPNSPLYIIPSGVKISGNLKTEYLLDAVEKIVNRHEILRTRFIENNGDGFQEILDDITIKPIEYEISELDDNYESKLNEILKEEFTKPFNLTECPLFRFVIINVSETIKYLLLPMHHIISDNWSTGILINEILEYYNHKAFEKKISLENINVQYLDYSIWQKEWLDGNELQRQKDYWVNKLKGSNEVLGIIPDKKRSQVQTYNGSSELFKINLNISNAIEEFCKREDITPFVFYLAVFQFLLSKYSHQNDINIGVPIANRNRAEIEPLIGFFINTLVLRGIIKQEDTVSNFIQETKLVAHEAYENQDIPFEMIVDELGLERDMSHTALFQAMLVLNNAPMTELNIEGLSIEPLEFDTGKTKFDLVLSLTKNNEEYLGKLEFNTDLYEKKTIENIISQFVFLLSEFIENPTSKLKEIKVLDKNLISNRIEDTQAKTDEFNSASFVHSDFIKVAQKFPNKIAITDGNKSLSYSELDNYSNIIASHLIEAGINSEESVGVYINRRIEYAASILAIFKSGGVFVPLDVNYPKERLDYIINDANIKYILTVNEFENSIEYSQCKILNCEDIQSNIEHNISTVKNIYPYNAAYIIYTSGSSGLPKGVVVEHSKFCNHVKQIIKDFEVTVNDKYLSFAAFNFDPSLEQLFVPLLTGAEVYLRNDNYWLPSDFIKLIKDKKITVINPPTVYWNQFVAEIKNSQNIDLGDLRLVIAGGEEMKAELLSLWKENVPKDIKLINAYGPTETLITSAIYKTEKNNNNWDMLHVPIGKSLGGRKVYVVDEYGNLLPEGVPGELCFGGQLLARCYQSRPDETANRFIPDQFSSSPGDRLYKTGDLVRYQDGLVEYLGRIDNQIKIRGFRIELGEVEKIILQHSLVKNVVVSTISGNGDESVLIAYVIINDTDIEVEEELLKHCSMHLPNYMIPSKIMLIEEMPINSNGKLDRKRLPIPDNLSQKSNQEFVLPRTDLEKEISEIVGNILNVEKVGVFDNFFELGGHSILAIKVISGVREKYGVDVQLKSLFENPTVVGLTEAVVAEQSNLLEDDELESLLSELEDLE